MLPNTRFREQKQIKKKLIIVFIYSKIVLTVDIINVLNLGLNFCILIFKIDITQHLVGDLNNPRCKLTFGMAK